MPLKDIIAAYLGLRVITWVCLKAIYAHYTSQREAMAKPILSVCIGEIVEPDSANRLWISAAERAPKPDVTTVTEKFIEKLRLRRLIVIPDLELTNQILLVTGFINAMFLIAALFIIYGSGFSVVCQEALCAIGSIHLPTNDLLRFTGLGLGICSFVYALWFAALLHLRRAIMDMLLWDSWKGVFKRHK